MRFSGICKMISIDAAIKNFVTFFLKYNGFLFCEYWVGFSLRKGWKKRTDPMPIQSSQIYHCGSIKFFWKTCTETCLTILIDIVSVVLFTYITLY